MFVMDTLAAAACTLQASENANDHDVSLLPARLQTCCVAVMHRKLLLHADPTSSHVVVRVPAYLLMALR